MPLGDVGPATSCHCFVRLKNRATYVVYDACRQLPHAEASCSASIFPGSGDQRRFIGAWRQQGKFHVRSPTLFAAGHILGATDLPHRMISETMLAPRVALWSCTAPDCIAMAPTNLRLEQLRQS